MNTIEELTDKYKLDIKTAQRMIDGYKKRIGVVNGVMLIDDITYIGDGTKEVKLVCTLCGKVYTHPMKTDRNKWSELRKTCNCEEERQMRQKQREEREKEKKREYLAKIENEKGKVYGDFTIVDYIYQAGEAARLIGKCNICGAEKHLALKNMDSHCSKHYVQTIKFDEKYIGLKNNYLTVKGITKGKDGRKRFLCECDCGNITVIKPTFWENGAVKSCGCYQENRSIDADEVTRIKGIYRGMKRRCYDDRDKIYSRYGGRGISICDEWLRDINAFINWSLENGYDNRLTIDRIDNDGNYEPDNCRWATYKLQNLNKSQRGKKSDYEDNNRPQNKQNRIAVE